MSNHVVASRIDDARATKWRARHICVNSDVVVANICSMRRGVCMRGVVVRVPDGAGREREGGSARRRWARGGSNPPQPPPRGGGGEEHRRCDGGERGCFLRTFSARSPLVLRSAANGRLYLFGLHSRLA